jgi:hypothetical protein
MIAAKRVYKLERWAFGGSAPQSFTFFLLVSSGVVLAGAFMLYLPPNVSTVNVRSVHCSSRNGARLGLAPQSSNFRLTATLGGRPLHTGRIPDTY